MMKKILLIVVLALAAFLIYKYAFKTDKAPKEEPKSLTVSAHSNAFKQSINSVLDSYYAMTAGFVSWDSAVVNTNATSLKAALDNVKMDDLKADSIIYETAMFPYDNAKGSITEILSGTNWEEKRRGLNDLSANLRMLLIAIKYDQNILYWQECPMAFGEGNSANWISKEEKIVNPYLGNKDPKYGATMIGCGETKEKIDFSAADSTNHQ